MKNSLVRVLSLALAGALQLMPLARSILPSIAQSPAPSGWGIVFRWATGAAALFGYDAISSASSIAISPANAIVGQFYVGTVSYSGGHAASSSSMQMSNICLASATALLPGLTIVYAGGNTASVSGTPTTLGTYPFTLKIFDKNGCAGGGNTDTRSTSLLVGTNSTSGGVAPSFSAAPDSVTAQVGADALLSAGAFGSPIPKYSWKQGLTPIPDATNSTLYFPAVQLTNAGLYTVTASNASGTASATCFLSVCITPGTNQLALNYTNYWPQGQALTMYSYITNAPAGSNVYKWQYNLADITTFKTNGNTFSLTAAQVTGINSGEYSVVFNSVVGNTTVVNLQQYYSFWSFGTPPGIQSPPQSTNVAAGGVATFKVIASGSNTLHYQWVLNSTSVLAGQTANTLTLNNVTAQDAGTYAAIVTNFWGSITSSPATLTVTASSSPPTITAEPSPRSILAGQSASFAISAAGTAPLSYHWKKGAVTLTDSGTVAGSTSNVLTLSHVGLGDAANYSVVITNVAGVTNSPAIALSVALPPILSINSSGTNVLELSATTTPGLGYLVESASNLTPTISWTPLVTNVVPGSGLVLYTNRATNSQQCFRLRFP